MPSWNLLGLTIVAALSQTVSSAVVSGLSSTPVATAVTSSVAAVPSTSVTVTIPISISTGTPTTITLSPTPVPTESSFLIHPNGNTAKCLDVQGAIFENGTPVQIFDCNGTPAQNWEIAPGEGAVRVVGTNFCLDAGSFPANGVGMKIWECFANLPAQDWFYTGDQRIALTNQGFCLDLTNGSTANGNRVQTWKCTDNNTNQVWTLSPGTSVPITSLVLSTVVPATTLLSTV